jgi:hypothetical protein
MAHRLRREQRRALWINRLETTAFWASVCAVIAFVWLLATPTP